MKFIEGAVDAKVSLSLFDIFPFLPLVLLSSVDARFFDKLVSYCRMDEGDLFLKITKVLRVFWTLSS